MFDRRLLRLFFVLAALLAVVAGRAFQLQVLRASDLRRKGESVLRSTTLVRPLRGEILWADGTPAVWNGSRYAVWIDTAAFDAVCHTCAACGDRAPRIPASRRCAECGASDWVDVAPPAAGDLAAAVGVDRGVAEKALARARDVRKRLRWRSIELFPELRLSEDVARAFALRAAEFPGITVRAQPCRVADPALATIAGRATIALDTDVAALTSPERESRGLRVLSTEEALGTLVGHTGFERRHDETLRGSPGLIEQRPARRGEKPPPPDVIREVADGRPVRTTLVRRVQEVANAVAEDSPAEESAAVVLDLADGAVVAVAARSGGAYCPAVSALAPGSVFKLVPALAMLECGLDPAETLDCRERGRLRSGAKYVCDALHGGVALHEAFARSCNHYFAQRALDCRGPALTDAYVRLGLDLEPKLGIGIRSLAPRVADWSVHTEQLGIGQAEALASPLQIAVAYGRLATRGRKIVPYIDRDAPPGPATRETDPVIARHADRLLAAARAVVESGTASRVRGLGALDAAGKTGTAEVDTSAGRLHNAWFAGFAPAAAPRFVAVVVHARIAKKHGAELAGPDVARLLEAALGER